ncbi:MAG: hypothetical protein M3083_05590 [Actinomycetota bacterium]|nr:hypothetical protein [Actinomycetota bacterium]
MALVVDQFTTRAKSSQSVGSGNAIAFPHRRGEIVAVGLGFVLVLEVFVGVVKMSERGVVVVMLVLGTEVVNPTRDSVVVVRHVVMPV